MSGLTVGSLFSGIGGLDLGLERAGMDVAWMCERDAYCRQVLARHWPNVPIHEDVTEVKWDDVERVDIVAGGFPCQPFSNAGLRAGTNDPRWLWPAFLACVRAVRPRYVLMENVAALVADTDAFGAILGDPHLLGFDAEWSVVTACSVGAPHARERVFLLAHRADGDESHHLSPDRRSAARQGEPRGSRRGTRRDGWLPEPEMDRVAHGLPLWMVRDPLHALGNAVVPQVGEWIGRRIVEAAS